MGLLDPRHTRLATPVIAVGWAAFVGALLLPLADDGSGGVLGWQAVLSAAVDVCRDPTLALTILLDPTGPWLVAIPAVAAVVLVTPALAVTAPRRGAWVAVGLAAAAAALPLELPRSVADHLLVGAYVWMAACGTLSVGCVLVRLARPPTSVTAAGRGEFGPGVRWSAGR